MNILLIFDISSSGIRNHIVKECKNIGLVRVQKSAFLGNPTETLLQKLCNRMMTITYNKNDSVQIYNLPDIYKIRPILFNINFKIIAEKIGFKDIIL